MAECSARPYLKLIKSGIPGPSGSKSGRPAALRPSPLPTMRVSSVGPSAANPTRGELLVQLETLTRKPRSVKRKNLDSAEKDRPVLAKIPKLGASSSPPRRSERVQSPADEAPIVFSSPSPPESAAKAKNISGGAVEQPLAVMLITVWNPLAKNARPPP